MTKKVRASAFNRIETPCRGVEVRAPIHVTYGQRFEIDITLDYGHMDLRGHPPSYYSVFISPSSYEISTRSVYLERAAGVVRDCARVMLRAARPGTELIDVLVYNGPVEMAHVRFGFETSAAVEADDTTQLPAAA